jgi:DNA-binding IclR family transcriptional regulator
MAAAVTFSKALKIVEQLAEKDREKLFLEMKERRRAVWLKQIEAEADETEKLRLAGKLTSISTAGEIQKFIDEAMSSNEP